MKEINFCICGKKCVKSGLCEDCLYFLKAKKSKNIAVIEKFRQDYIAKYDTYKSYGQFVLLIDMIDRRKKEVDNRRKKETAKKVWRNR